MHTSFHPNIFILCSGENLVRERKKDGIWHMCKKWKVLRVLLSFFLFPCLLCVVCMHKFEYDERNGTVTRANRNKTRKLYLYLHRRRLKKKIRERKEKERKKGETEKCMCADKR